MPSTAAWRRARLIAPRSTGRSRPSRWRSSSTSPPATCRRPWSARRRRTCSSTCAARCSRTCSACRCRFMDKTEVGRLMSRLQGDVNAMQEFLETSVLSVGDIALLFGIVGVMVCARLAARPADAVGDAGAVRRPADLAAAGARRLHGGARDAARPPTARWRRASTACARCRAWTASRVNFMLYDDKARANLGAHLTAARYAQVMVPIVDTLTGIAMAVVIVVGGTRVLGRAARRRRDGGLPLLHPAVLRPDPLAHHAVLGDAAGDGLGPPDHRGAGRAGRRRGPAGRGRAGAGHGRLGRVPRRDLRLRPAASGAAST